jgi:hypothetical protein
MRSFNFKKFYLIIFLIPIFVLGDYKNTNGKAIKKPLKDLIKWQLNKTETNIEIIDISEGLEKVSILRNMIIISFG